MPMHNLDNILKILTFNTSDIWQRILYERVTESIHLNLFSILVSLFGSYRAKIDFDLILRQHNAYGILRAADEARKLGLQSVTLIEFGVAAGAGLINMCKIAEKVSSITGIDILTDVSKSKISTGTALL
jgi:hypothetical protein